MNKLRYFTRLYCASCFIAALAATLLLGVRHHRPDQIAVAIATPLILLQLVPYVLLKIPHQHLPVAQADMANSLTGRTRLIIKCLIGGLLLCGLAAAIGISILASLPVYHALDLNWAIRPGAEIGALLILAGGVVPGSFVAGAYLTSRLKGFNLVAALFGAASKEGDRIGRIQHA